MFKNKPECYILHTAASSNTATVDDLNQYHKERFGEQAKSLLGFYIGYHFVITRNGSIVQTRDVYEEGIHCLGKNFSSIGIALMGNGDIDLPTKEQETSLKHLLKRLSELTKIDWHKTFNHRVFADKTCPGKLLSDTYAVDLMMSEYGSLMEKLILALKKYANR